MKLRNSLIVILTFMLTLSFFSMPVYASTKDVIEINKTTSYFQNEWEYTITYKLKSTGTKIGTLTYGFDTDFTDEDYAWTKGTECDTKAGIRRVSVDDAASYSSYKAAGKYSKYEVKHVNTHIKYVIVFRATYGDFTTSKKVTSNKG